MSLQTIRFITDIVDAFLPFLGALIILNENLRKLWPKTLVYSLIYGSAIFLTDNISLDFIRVSSNIIISFLLLKGIFRLTYWSTLKMFITANLLGFVSNFFVFCITQYGLKIPIKQAVTEKSVWLKVILPGEFLNLLIAFAISRVRTGVLYFFANVKENLNVSVIRSLGLIIIIQVSVLMSLIIDVTLAVNVKDEPFKALYVMLSVLIVIALNVLILKKSISVTTKETLEAAQDSISENIMDLVNSVRSQRHDFINHIQVLSSLLQLGKVDGMRTYLSQLSSEVSVCNRVLEIENPIIGALLNAKITQAELKDIKFEVNIDTSLSNITPKVLELTRILGNLINNAMDAVENLSPNEKWINLSINEKGPFTVFTVSNPGSPPDQSERKLFEPGFTTKDDSHSGLGLYICKQLAQKLHGSIDHNYNPLLGISFSLIIPKS